MYAWVSIHKHIFAFYVLSRSKSNDNPVEISTLGAQILIPKYHFVIEGTRAPCEVVGWEKEI